VGKTTTKELIVSALATSGPVLATPGNFNNEVGVPQTLLRLDRSYRYAVLEMGMRGPGQIAELAVVAKPEIAVITNVGTAHIGLLGSREAIAKVKCELLEHVASGGLAVLHHDPLLLETARSVYGGRTVSFGLGAGDLAGRLEPGDQLLVEGQRFDLPLPGAHHALALLATLATARELGVPWSELEHLRLELPPGRGRRVEQAGVILLDETYNAGPESMKAALQLLAAERCTRRIAVLGTMLELGDHGPELHRDVGATVSELGIDALMVLGDTPEVEALLQGARAVECSRFSSQEALVVHLHQTLRPGDAVLFKASRSVGLDRVVAGIEGLR
jgi:UDP-N-acetylmuramoyl-tripeptide--D-alanyl-D-alanine ligase